MCLKVKSVANVDLTFTRWTHAKTLRVTYLCVGYDWSNSMTFWAKITSSMTEYDLMLILFWHVLFKVRFSIVSVRQTSARIGENLGNGQSPRPWSSWSRIFSSDHMRVNFKFVISIRLSFLVTGLFVPLKVKYKNRKWTKYHHGDIVTRFSLNFKGHFLCNS